MPDAGRRRGYEHGREPAPGPGPDPVDAGGRGPLLPYGLAEVVGPSMLPALRPGDRLVVRYGAPVRPGDVVVLRHPMQQDLLIVKRAAERREGGWWMLGDNPAAESDSREFGVVPAELVLARARLRLRPPRMVRAQRSPAALLSWMVSAVRPVPSSRRPAGPVRALSRRLRAR
ncbi:MULTISPECIES: nickel-type superoxide dismutase maturation protease [Streptomyces]|uniref:Nickel-type superoxide dismutase maturation protease n=1 Tax=Streptomyces xinghaiensis TaxID=1038928 RepID=A0A3R7IA34_9ACTN|nr:MULTISPECIES: nickel-type superoxide dismutase maturation protease [Streptomyces]PQM24230.1 nickel-type superoxide dismutase maturation protease [Streptomyces xinghaiensis]RKM97195.1 nickel-type superoxide dismutase maturation protease [Streptomyces xinghaiensis]RNC75411.1 nickel-type superoxide dismutase maturation protease [Streptomyces xinghaiensis]